MKEKIMKQLQLFGKSLLLPITLLAAVGIIVGLTASLDREAVQNLLPFMQNEVVKNILLTIRSLSLDIFGLIPVMFAISIAFGMAKKEQGVAALAGFIVYFTMLAAAGKVATLSDYPANELTSVLGISTVNMGAFGGIVAGILAVVIHNKFYNLKLPTAIAFFGGKRSVAIIGIFCAAILGCFLPMIWSPVNAGLTFLGTSISKMGYFGSFLYGFLENILVPTGLHHIIISIFRTTEVGGTLIVDGTTYVGCWNAFLGGFGVDGVEMSQLGEFTRYLSQGRLPIFVFGFPAAAFAMYRSAAVERRTALKPLLIAGVLAIFVTGIQEPLLFLFLFAAPQLFIFNSVMIGLSFMFMDMLGVVIGNTQGGVIDLLVYGVFAPGSRWYWAVVVGIAFAVIYYFVFYYYIKKRNVIIAPGVGDVEDENEAVVKLTDASGKELTKDEQVATKIIEGLGGKENITDVNNCFTRLRVDLVSIDKIDEKVLTSTGAVGVNKINSTHVQVIYGPKVDVIATNVKSVLGV